jgi:hypothetical protein
MAIEAKRFVTARLSFNLGNIGGDIADCNPGGSVWCSETKCGGSSCFGSTCSGGSCSVTKHEIDSRIIVEQVQLEALQKQLVAVIEKFAAKR